MGNSHIIARYSNFNLFSLIFLVHISIEQGARPYLFSNKKCQLKCALLDVYTSYIVNMLDWVGDGRFNLLFEILKDTTNYEKMMKAFAND